VILRRAQLTLILAALLPTILATPVGIVILVMHSSAAVTIVGGLLILAFCTSALTGYILASIFLSRGASLAKVQQDFLSSVSHELTTPITSVRLFIDTLKGDRVTDPAERAKCLHIIDREMLRLDGLVGKLIALSKIEAGRQPFEQSMVSVSQLVDDALGSFEVTRVGAAVDLTVEVQPGLEVTGDRATLGQVLSNLLGNAWKYSPAEGRKIALRALGDRRHVHIEVADNGPGVPEEERRRIFDEFERGRAAAQSRAGGFGLGLAIVRAIVRAHGGRIELHENPGGGALFRVTLPRRLSLAGTSSTMAPVRARSGDSTR
jgi:two-component system phosphate regulon sensor histidine kinase PhoR